MKNMPKILRNTLFVLFAFVLPYSGFGQYKMFTETGYAFKLREESNSGFSIHLVQGMTLGESGFFVGLGGGFDMHFQNEFSYNTEDFFTLPVFVDLRYALIEDSFSDNYSGLYYMVSGGYAFVRQPYHSEREPIQNGVYLLSGLGGVINIGAKNVSLNLNVCYRFEGLSVASTENRLNSLPNHVHSLLINFGAIFKPGGKS
ncbi:MAG: hypothetical protein AAF990_00755 [Bacteroidota bacterium]